MNNNKIPKNAYLEVIRGNNLGLILELKNNKTVIGRRTGDIILQDKKASGTHALIEFIAGNFFIFDLDSLNGIFVNSKQVKKAKLKHDDKIQIGYSTILISIGKPPKKHPPIKKANIQEQDKTQTKGTQVYTEIRKTIEGELKKLDTHDGKSSSKGNLAKVANPPKLKSAKIYLQILEPKMKNNMFQFQKGSILIGRINADFNLNHDSDVSRKHSLIEVFSEAQIYIRDLDSTNGTYVNNRKVSSQKLKNGDLIAIGNTVMKLFIELS
ncbi:MAG: FHA domain-containing protein [Pseudomonadota bacterium]